MPMLQCLSQAQYLLLVLANIRAEVLLYFCELRLGVGGASGQLATLALQVALQACQLSHLQLQMARVGARAQLR